MLIRVLIQNTYIIFVDAYLPHKINCVLLSVTITSKVGRAFA